MRCCGPRRFFDVRAATTNYVDALASARKPRIFPRRGTSDRMTRASPSLKFSPQFEDGNGDDELILTKAGLKDSAKILAVYNGRRSARRPGPAFRGA
jgi:hypothetical protein